jgi:hypothetical protein
MILNVRTLLIDDGAVFLNCARVKIFCMFFIEIITDEDVVILTIFMVNIETLDDIMRKSNDKKKNISYTSYM